MNCDTIGLYYYLTGLLVGGGIVFFMMFITIKKIIKDKDGTIK